MPKDDIVAEGVVSEVLPDHLYRVVLDSTQEQKTTILAYLSGKMRLHRIRILAGDRVQVEISPYDLTRGRVSRRL